MNVLVSSINFHPDHAGIAVYSTDLPVFLAEQGDRVTMVTGFPYYPQWRKAPGDSGRLFRREQWRGVEVLRGYLYVPRRVSTLTRIAHELTFGVFAALNFLRAERPDVIIVLSPPLLLGMIGVLFSKLWRVPLVVHVQDLPVDAAINLGMLNRGPVFRIASRIERFINRHAARVITISEGMKQVIMSKGLPESRVGMIPNWIDVRVAASRGTPGRFRAETGTGPDDLIVAYAGNIGVKQGVDLLIEVARATQDDRRLRYFIIGEGADKPRLRDLADRAMLSNLTFLPMLPSDDYVNMLADIDISFVAQRAGAGDVFFPSKVLGIMAMGKPLLVSADLSSELAKVVTEAGAGLVAAPGDVPALVSHLRRFAADPALGPQLSHGGREHVKRFDRAAVLTAFRQEAAALIRR